VVAVVDELGAKAKLDAVDDTPLVEMECGYHLGGEITSARRPTQRFPQNVNFTKGTLRKDEL